MAKLTKKHNKSIVFIIPILLLVVFIMLLTYSYASFHSYKLFSFVSSYFVGNRYTLTYNVAGCSSKTIRNGFTYGTLCTPESAPEGYTFSGWLKGDNLITSSSLVRTSSDVELTANYSPRNYNYYLNYNKNIVPPLEDTNGTVHACNYLHTDYSCSNYIDYVIDNEVVTVTSTGIRDDSFGIIEPWHFDLEAGKNYILTIDTDSEWNGSSGTDTVELYLFLNGASAGEYNPNEYLLRKNTGDYYTFTPIYSGAYYVRVDINKSGETHKFWNLVVSEISSVNSATYDSPYGNFSSVSYANHSLIGWNSKNLFNVNNTTSQLIQEDGSISNNENWVLSDYILVKPGTYNFSYDNANTTTYNQYSISYFDADKNFVSRDYEKGWGSNEYSTTFTVPLGIAYIRLAYGIKVGESSVTRQNVLIEKNDHQTTYEPYLITGSNNATQPFTHYITALWRSNYDLNLLDKTAGVPSGLEASNETNRSFDMNTYVVGMHYDNSYNPENVSTYTVSNRNILVTESKGYGIGVPLTLPAGDYYLNGRYYSYSSNDGIVGVIKYQNDGSSTYTTSSINHQSNINLHFSVENNVSYIVIVFTSNTAGNTAATINYSDLKLSKTN